MSLQPPKIDKRSYDDVVAHTQKLAEYFTSIEVRATVEELQGQILAEDIKNENKIIATSGQFINKALAEQISNIQNLVRVKVKRWLPRSTEVSPKYLLGRTLAQDIKNGTELIATTGKVVDATLVEKIAQIQGLESVKVKLEKDGGWALICIFGRMAALVSDRLNQVPNKNFLAFLDLIGTQLLPSQPAKVPLTFSLAEGSPVDAVVPAHTQVAAPPAEGQEEEVVFETDRELVVTTAQLQAVFVREPGKDKYSDRTLEATGKEDAAFEAFAGEQPIEHCLYLACDELFTLPGSKTITLKLNSPEATNLAKLPINWSYWDGSWQVLNPTISLLEGSTLQVVIPNLPVPIKRTINGIEAGWIKASLHQSFLEEAFLEEDAKKETTQLKVKDVRNFMVANTTIRLAAGSSNQEDCKIIRVDPNQKTLTLETPLKYKHPKETSVWLLSKLPSVNRITASAKIERNDLTPDLCFFNTVPIDLSKDFYPFGEQPHFNDTLYISSKEAFFQPGAVVTVIVTLSEGLSVKADGGVIVAWEVWDGRKWLELLKGSSSASTPSPANFTTSTTKDNKLSLTLPATIAPTLVNGESNYWIRVRIVNKGNYGSGTAFGQPITFATFSEDANIGSTELKVNSTRGFMAGDSVRLGSGSNTQEERTIGSVKDASTLTLTQQTTFKQVKGSSVLLLSNPNFGPPSIKSLKLSYTYTKNDVSLSACQTYNDLTYVNRTDEVSKSGSSFQPFTSSTDKYPALYLGFDKPFANRSTTLYFQVEPPKPDEVATELKTNNIEPVRLVWEYASPSGWSSLGAKDETNGFAQRGLIQFIGPTDFIKTSQFDKELYWLRVCHERGEFRVPPRLRRILTNTIWATQATTLEDEILGSSDGNPNQIFRTTQIPVLQGQKLEVQEPQIPSAEEQAAIESLEGEDAIALIRDEAGQIEEVWVRWHEVPDFYASKPRDRHYVLDRFSGEARFGDGQYGMVPPQGRQNIRLSSYQTGGGTRGNLPANTVVQLKTTVPYVDSVTNLEAAGGGTEQESLEQVKERGPKFLRHRGRAVTVQDFEDLAYEASPDVARAKAIAPTFGKPPHQDKPLFDPLDPNLWLDPNAKTSNGEHDKVKALNAGQLRLLIVPRSSARQPVPSLALLDRVKAYIGARCAATVDLQVTGPQWQDVSVTATVVPVSFDVADATRAAVVKRLEEFLHPLTGGKEGRGWVLGRLPHKSDLYAVIEAIKEVKHVQSLDLKPEPDPDPEKQQLSPEQLVYSGTHTIKLSKEEA